MTAPDETPLAFLKAERPFGVGWDYFLLCFTVQRVIVARTGRHNELPAIISTNLFDSPGALGSGDFLEISERQVARRADELRQHPPQAILESHKSNFQIPYADLRRITVRQARRGAIILTLHSAAREEWFALTASREQLTDAAARLKRHLDDKWDFALPPEKAVRPWQGWLESHGITRWLITDMVFIAPIGLGVGAALGWGLGVYLNSVDVGPQTEIILAVVGAFLGLIVAGRLNPEFDNKQAAIHYLLRRLGDYFENDLHPVRQWLEGLGQATWGAVFGLVYGAFHWRAITLSCGAVLGYLVAGPHGWNPWQTAVYGAALIWGALAFLSLVLGALINALLEHSLWISWVIPAGIVIGFALLSGTHAWGGYGPALGVLTGAGAGLLLTTILSRLWGRRPKKD